MAARCRRVVASRWVDPLILAIIVANATVLGLQTYESIDASFGDELELANDVILAVFVGELAIRIGSYGRRPWEFFRSGWNLLDFAIIAASPGPGLRANATLLRVVRLLRNRPRRAAVAGPSRPDGRGRPLRARSGGPGRSHAVAGLRLRNARLADP